MNIITSGFHKQGERLPDSPRGGGSKDSYGGSETELCNLEHGWIHKKVEFGATSERVTSPRSRKFKAGFLDGKN